MFHLHFVFRFALSLFVLLIVSCATVDKNRVDPFGRGPYPEDYEFQVQAFTKHYLIDPGSLIVNRIDPPKKGIIKSNPSGRTLIKMHYNDEIWYGYANFNAKNRYGGYVGNQEYVYWCRAGIVILCEPESSYAFYYKVEPSE